MSVAALPRVEGRHRNRALAAARRARAIELRTQGWTYQQIAQELGYANRGTVWHIVNEAVAARAAQAVDDLRLLEHARLDALQAALWEAAMAGDVSAAQAVLRVIMARVRLLGLAESAATQMTSSPRTVVLSPS